MKKGMICYMCNNPAVSKEHVPARSFFPEDSKYRINLFTVMSCNVHNENTSDDDQYIRDVVVMSAFGSQLAEKQFNEKTLPYLSGWPSYLSLFVKEVLAVVYNNMETKAFSVDRQRFDRIMRKYAYAIFYKHFKKHWERKLIVLTDKLFYKDDASKQLYVDDYGELLQELKRDNWPPPNDVFLGSNQDIFKYVFIPEHGDENNMMLIMVFYNVFDVWIYADSVPCEPAL